MRRRPGLRARCKQRFFSFTQRLGFPGLIGPIGIHLDRLADSAVFFSSEDGPHCPQNPPIFPPRVTIPTVLRVKTKQFFATQGLSNGEFARYNYRTKWDFTAHQHCRDNTTGCFCCCHQPADTKNQSGCNSLTRQTQH